MKHIGKSGALLAAAAFSFAVSGATIAPVQADEAKVHCVGVNSCKGQSECKTASSSCKGQNGCKGKGFVDVANEDECKTKGGTVMAKM